MEEIKVDAVLMGHDRKGAEITRYGSALLSEWTFTATFEGCRAGVWDSVRFRAGGGISTAELTETIHTEMGSSVTVYGNAAVTRLLAAVV